MRKLRWETLQSDKYEQEQVVRTKIPGGWLVMVDKWDINEERPVGVGVTFVPDPEHKWDGSSLS